MKMTNYNHVHTNVVLSRLQCKNVVLRELRIGLSPILSFSVSLHLLALTYILYANKRLYHVSIRGALY